MTDFRFTKPVTRLAVFIALFIAGGWLIAMAWQSRHTVAAAQLPDSPDGVWHQVDRTQLTNKPARPVPTRAATLKLDEQALARALGTAARENGNSLVQSKTFLHLPLPTGDYLNFRLEESSVLDPSLAARFPEIKSYRGVATDDPTITMRADWTPLGFHALVLTAQRTYSIHAVKQGGTDEYVSYDAGETLKATEDSLQCLTVDDRSAQSEPVPQRLNQLAMVGPTRRHYRLAWAATTEYCATYGGGTVSGTLASLNTRLNSINAIYERDLNIRMTLVDNMNILYAGVSDPFTNGNPSAMLNEVRPVLYSVVGVANYDIGHVIGTGGAGVAYVERVCSSSGTAPLKGGGVSCIGGDLNSATMLNLIVHEMGHQFGAPHSFNGTTGNCGGGNRSSDSAVEPGSGVSVMSYAGLCGNDDVASSSNLRFHAWSTAQIINNTTGGTGSTCGTGVSTGNQSPVVNAGSDYTIPRGTPFQLTGTGSDADGDAVTYSWEQVDIGGSFSNPPYADQSDGSTRPLFRSYAPMTTPVRVVPALTYILNNANTPPDYVNGLRSAEVLPTFNRTLTFRLLARDQRGGVTDDEARLTVGAAAGPFLVTAPNVATTWTGGTQQPVAWSVNGTNAPPINCANVRILLSTDGGLTFPVVINANTPNDGSETIVVPAGYNTTTARLRVEAVGNIFFDISDTNFTLAPGASCGTLTLSPTIVPNGMVGVAYNQNFTASGGGGAPSYNFAVSAGALPNGLALSSAGVLSGTPTTNNTFNFTVRATDQSGCSGTQNYSVTIVQSLPNLALNKTATQSSTAYGGTANRAVDGNTNGNWVNNSVTHTNADAQAWWQMNLGSVATIETINVWNRTDCCGDRLSNFYVFVSNVPFTSTNLSATLSQPGVSNYYVPGQAGSPTTLSINRTGRFVRVQLTEMGFLSLAEVAVLGVAGISNITNVALNRTAAQSSTVYGGTANRAVDGNTNGNWGNNSVTHTNADAQAWWQVDLGSVATIETINVWNRTDCCGDRLSNFYVFVSNIPFTSPNLSATLSQSGVSNYYVSGQASSPTTLDINRTGRFVRVQLAGTEFVSLAEIEVLGVAGIGNVTNVALNKTATQSSTAYDGTASRAVDGNTNGNWGNNSVTHTNADAQAWWQVDLGSVATIETINVWNRNDCCSSRLSNFYVFVSDVPFTSTNLSATLSQAGVTNYPTAGQSGSLTTLTLNRTGRYVRVQLAGTEYLSLAEIEVLGVN
ncbi:MAG: hypothetical protein HOP19_05975 [Acidobacteria bacterium]|nr:hypothetical protein [Acidobacteriota bacterium]